ncbi:acyltransferase [Sphingomonas cavernae]|uniref:Acyltransferase n=1 Tax=Sphingomonas cavernae TaxID=2320861 RepID=A0A418WRU9_9SPHN|nr:acyltransferase [Sphingomonas cavernae]RJF93889.1 acyltransferase [Sphingomonas cavernae]
MTADALSPAMARDPVAAQPADATYVGYLDLLRGVAILLIVMLHAGNAFLLQGVGALTPSSTAALAINHILFHDSTLYFSIISGVLYGHLFWRRAHWPFFRARLLNIGSPYVVVSFVLTAIAWALAVRRGDEATGLTAFARELGFNIATGDAWNTLWYIPVILGLYAISPLLSRLARSRRWRWAVVAIILLPLLISRTGTVLTPSIFVYFGGAYMFGLVLGIQLDRSLDLLTRCMPWLCGVALLATAALAMLHIAGIDRIGFTSLRETFFYIQRLGIASMLLVALRAWSGRPASVWRSMLAVAASASFGIYFVHGPILRPIARLVGGMVPPDQPWWALLAGVVATFLAGFALSLAIIALVRRALGKRSRLVIGS